MNKGWYKSPRSFKQYLRRIYRNKPEFAFIAEWLLLELPRFADGKSEGSLPMGWFSVSYKTVCREFGSKAIKEYAFSRLMKDLRYRGLIQRREFVRNGRPAFYFYSEWYKETQSRDDSFDIEKLQVAEAKLASQGGEICKSTNSHNSLEECELQAVQIDVCKKEDQFLQVDLPKNATHNSNKKDSITEEKGIDPLNPNQEAGGKKGSKHMNMRAAITPRVKTVRTRTTKPKREWTEGNELPSSKASSDGFKSPVTVIRAFVRAVKSTYSDVPMSDQYFHWDVQTEPAGKAIDWIREVIYMRNDVSEPDIRVHMENWIAWYVSNKIDKKYRFKREPLSLQAFYESRNGYFAVKESNDVLMSRRQRKVPVQVINAGIMDSFARIAKVEGNDVVENFIDMALGAKGIVLTCLYVDRKGLVTDVVATVKKVLERIKARDHGLGRDRIRKIYAETWRFRSPAVAKNMVPYYNWEELFGDVWADIPKCEKLQGSADDHRAAEDFFTMCAGPKV
jgi:hypothetical protein